MAIINATVSTFDNLVLNSDTPVVVDFWAPWCAPCRAMGPALDRLSEEFDERVTVVKVNIDQEQPLAQAFNVRGVPTLIAMAGSEVADAMVGYKGPKALEKFFKRLAKKHPVASSQTSGTL